MTNDENEVREKAYNEFMFERYTGLYSKDNILRMIELSIDWDEFLEDFNNEM